MKLPWSTKKKAEYEYTKYSAPVVNGILRRNIKGSSSVPDLRGLDDLRVSFADLPIRTSSSQSLSGMVCTPTTERSRRSTTTTNATLTLERRPSKDDRKKRGDGCVGVDRPKREGSTRRNSAQEDDKSKRENRRQKTQQQKRSNNRDRRAEATEATPDRRKELRRRSSTGNMRSITNTSNRVANNKLKLTTSIISEGSGSSASVSDTVGSLDNPKRLGDLAGDELANSYGKWESNGTIETAVSSGSEESRPARKLLQEQSQSLNELLDEKIQAKMRREEKEKRTL